MAYSERFDEDENPFSGTLGPPTGPFAEWWENTGRQFTPNPNLTLQQHPNDDPDTGFPPTNHPAIRPPDALAPEDIESLRTSPLEEPPAGDFQRISPLFQRRYGQYPTGQPGQPRRTAPPGSPQHPTTAEEGNSTYGRRQAEHHFNAALNQRRAEDERMTGRRWPGNSIANPVSPYEASFLDALTVALGEVDPRIFAREGAMRYVRSAIIPGEDGLGPTDIYALLYYGLGLTLRPLDCTGLPHVLAVYHRATREIYLDWKLLKDPPYGRAVFDSSAWRRAVDGSVLVRFLLAWCGAIHLTDNYDVPLVLGFSPQAAALSGGAPPAAAPIAADTLNRYRKAMLSVATLLAPAERLWQQIAALRLRVHMGDPEWRSRMRAEYSYNTGYGGQSGPGSDPAEHLIAVLAERNNCPPMLIEAQLDGAVQQMEWGMWSVQLLREVPELQMRFQTAARMFHQASAKAGQAWAPPGRAPEVQPIQVQLSL